MLSKVPKQILMWTMMQTLLYSLGDSYLAQSTIMRLITVWLLNCSLKSSSISTHAKKTLNYLHTLSTQGSYFEYFLEVAFTSPACKLQSITSLTSPQPRKVWNTQPMPKPGWLVSLLARGAMRALGLWERLTSPSSTFAAKWWETPRTSNPWADSKSLYSVC